MNNEMIGRGIAVAGIWISIGISCAFNSEVAKDGFIFFMGLIATIIIVD